MPGTHVVLLLLPSLQRVLAMVLWFAGCNGCCGMQGLQRYTVGCTRWSSLSARFSRPLHVNALSDIEHHSGQRNGKQTPQITAKTALRLHSGLVPCAGSEVPKCTVGNCGRWALVGLELGCIFAPRLQSTKCTVGISAAH